MYLRKMLIYMYHSQSQNENDMDSHFFCWEMCFSVAIETRENTLYFPYIIVCLLMLRGWGMEISEKGQALSLLSWITQL